MTVMSSQKPSNLGPPDETQAEAFWRSQFAGLEAPSFPKLPSFAYEPIPNGRCQLKVQLSENREGSISLSTMIKLGWAFVISRFSSSRDVVLGVTTVDRLSCGNGIESKMTVATLPYRIILDGDQTVCDLMAAVQRQTSYVSTFHDTCLERIRKYSPEADAACQFQNRLIIVNPLEVNSKWPQNYVKEETPLHLGDESSALSVTCQRDLDDHTICMTAAFDINVISEQKVQALLRNLESTLCQLAMPQVQKLSDLAILHPFDRDQLRKWNCPVPKPERVCAHELIQHHCQEQPNSEAVSAWDGTFTYAEIADLSDSISAQLVDQGVRPDVIVPILFEKSRWLPVAMLSVMKAGGAVVLLDPSHPFSRLEEICRQVRSHVLVTSQAHSTLGQNLCTRVLTVSDSSISAIQRAETYTWPRAKPDHALYAVFTSGSTGKPKGVVIDHFSYCTAAREHLPAFHLDRTSRVLQFASNAFDACILEILGALICGGCICIPSESQRIDQCIQSLNSHRVSHAFFTPSFARSLKDQGSPRHLRALIFIGEEVQHADIAQWKRTAELMNGYGPSECSAITTVRRYTDNGTPPNNIGYAHGAVCWVVDPQDASLLVPIGAIGELIIEGPIVGRGYLDDAARTAESFIQAPSWLQEFREKDLLPETTLYKTGDLVRYEADGSLCYLGRKDSQVKIRGQRLELGEIENHIRCCFPNVQDVVVEVIKPATKNPSLVAFVCQQEAPTPLQKGATKLPSCDGIGISIGPDDIVQLSDWNCIPAPLELCVHEIFEERWLEKLVALAVHSWDGSFTYHALQELSAHLARHLVSCGVQLGDYIPICSEKSRWTVVAILAAIMAGGAIILLDPSDSKEDLRKVCEQAKCRLIITSSKFMMLGLDLVGEVVITGDYSFWTPHDQNELPLPKILPKQPLFASVNIDSIGEVRGTVVEHRSFLAYAVAFAKQVGVDGTAKWLQWAPYSTWLSILEMLGALISGACICIPKESKDLNDLAEAATLLDASHACLTPSFAATLQPERIHSLRTLVTVGEPLTRRVIELWSERVHLVNSHGYAECGITCVQPRVSIDSDPNRVGSPISSGCWLVDPKDHDCLVPIGAVGELLIEGPAVSLASFNDPKGMAASLVPPPTWMQAVLGRQNPVYKTGDLLRYNRDGSLNYIGRVGSSTLRTGDSKWSINDKADPFIVPNSSFHKQSQAADARLRNKIPSFMIPSIFIPLSYIPRTATSKINRQHLRQSVLNLSEAQLRQYRLSVQEHQAPSNESEVILRTIWANVLNMPQGDISVNDNFLHLGGDSISAMYAAAAARDNGLTLTVADILNNPTLSAQASISGLQQPDSYIFETRPFSLVNEDTKSSVIQILQNLKLIRDSSNIADIVPVTEGQSFFLKQWTPSHYCHFYDGPVDIERLRTACKTVVSNHSILRTAFLDTKMGAVQAVLQHMMLPFEHLSTEEDLALFCDTLWQNDCEISATLGQRPLKFTFVSRSPTEHAFIVRLSHAQYDGVSLPILFGDLASEYDQPGSTSPGVKFHSYVYFSSSRSHETAFSFWRSYLHGSTMTALPPTFSTFSHRPRNANCQHSGSQRVVVGRSITLPKPSLGITVATVIKAASAAVLSRAIGCTDLVLGQAANGRSMPLPGIEKTLGSCLNMIPFRVTLQHGWKVIDLLEHVQKQSTSTLGYDFLGLRDITKNCTEWPEETQFGCVIQHQNVNQTPSLNLGTLKSKSSSWAHFIPQTGLWILSTPQPDHLQIMICTSDKVMSAEMARSLNEDLCATILRFAEFPYGDVDPNIDATSS